MINDASPPAQPALHPIAEFLKEKQISNVVVIDDAFDEQRSQAELISGEISSFWERIEFDEEAQAALQSAGLALEDEFGLEDDDVLQRLWELRDTPNTLGDAVRSILFAAVIEKQSFLTEFVKRLRERLGLTVFTEGRNIDVNKVFEDKEIQLVFLDYIMGPENLKESVTSSKNIARNIYANHKDRKMPLVILMSTVGEVYERGNEFRRSSGLLMGMFYVVHKDELASEPKLYLDLGVWSKALPLGAELQSFVNTLGSSIKSASIKFMNGIKELSLEDYRYVQRLSLKEDGQPLGDYLIGLYSAYLSHLLFERDAALRAQRNLVDKLTSSYPPPGSTLPSDQLAKIYHAALFELEEGGESGYESVGDGESDGSEYQFSTADEVVEQRSANEAQASETRKNGDDELKEIGGALVDEQSKAEIVEADSSDDVDDDLLDLYEEMYKNNGSTFPRTDHLGVRRELRLGDLFIRLREKQALIIINADCDLAHECDPSDSIYLMPGRLQFIKDRIGEEDTRKDRTELFATAGESYRIIWEIKKITTVKFSAAHTFLETNQFVWKARLRQPYALELQRIFAADLTRIGMPVPPPIIQPIGVQLMGRVSAEGWIEMMSPSDDLAVVVMKTDKIRFYPTGSFAHRLRDMVIALLAKLREHQAHLGEDAGSNQAELARIANNITLLEDFNRNFEVWFCGIEELVLPGEGKVQKLPNQRVIGITWNLTDAPRNDSPLVVINITGLNVWNSSAPPSVDAGQQTTLEAATEPVVASRQVSSPEVDFPQID